MPKRKSFTEDEYMLLERASPVKSEYYNGEIFAMAGATYPHVRIAGNLMSQLDRSLKDQPCEPLASDMMVKVEATGLRAYPDVIVACEPKVYENDEQRVLLNPAIVIEIISETIEKYDRTTKLRHYKQIPSVQQIVLIEQDEPTLEVYTRREDAWSHDDVTGIGQSLSLSSLGITIPLAGIYHRIIFPAK